MIDVVEIAKTRRDALAAEIAKLDEFLRMAEKLMKYTPLKSNKASNTEDAMATRSTGPAPVRSFSEASGEKAEG